MLARSTSSTRQAFWRTDWFAAVVVVLVILVLHLNTELFGGLENRFYDAASTSTNRQPSDRVAVIAIDDASVAAIGRWPWPRDVHAKMIDKLAAAKAKVIVQTTFFFEPETDRGLTYIRKIKDVLTANADTAGAGDAQAQQIAQIVAEAEVSLDTDTVLAASVKKAGNVLVPSAYRLGEPQGRPDAALPVWAKKYAIADDSGFYMPAVSGQQPVEAVGAAALGVGPLAELRDSDGTVRREPLVVNHYGQSIPTISVLAVHASLNLGPSDIRYYNGVTEANSNPVKSVRLGSLRVLTDSTASMLPQFYATRDSRPPFATFSFSDVMADKIPMVSFADKIVLIGATAAGIGTHFAVPGKPDATPVDLLASTISSIISEQFIVEPDWESGLEVLVGLLVAGYLVTLLPRLSAGVAAVASLALVAGLLGVEYGMLSSARPMWLHLVFPAILLGLGHVALTTKRFLMTEAGKIKADEETAETNRMMGLALQGQGQLDMAFDRFSRAPMGPALMDNLYNLALDFERKRQFNKAQAVYEHMSRWQKDYKDLQVKLNRAKNLSETVMLGGGGAHPGGTLVLDTGAVEKPMLGRYQVEKELGKGAMGVVYQGKDPKIGRVVAIKTLALSQEFEGDELKDARERFFREAETAGRLQHQNIVTIFDAGEEHDLAYIAMEFLKGKDLVEYCKEGHLLPIPTVISVVTRVAEALAYAHQQHVVHRDIKPANIMYEVASDTVKVTDFGIARITDSSKTKTGMVLGTPSYMSPEQLAGRKVDGRSDLYSLGVMLFQMLCGVLPFRGESMAELMYKISNEVAPDVRGLRKEVPDRLAAIVSRALAKEPDQRYQDGNQFAAELAALSKRLTAEATVPSQAFEATVPQFSVTQRLNAQEAAGFATTVVYPGAASSEPGGASDPADRK